MSDPNRQTETVPVWDLIVRLGHWVLVGAFFTAYLSGDELPSLHVWAGYTVTAVLVIRLVWGVIGTRHARFASFVTGPRRIGAYLAGLMSGQAERHLGHNPAGAAMILALIISLAGTTVSGMALLASEEGRGPLAGVLAQTDPDPAPTSADASRVSRHAVNIAGDRDDHDGEDDHEGYENHEGGEVLETVHSAFTYLTLALVALHILGVIASSLAHNENLVRAMITGRKRKSDEP